MAGYQEIESTILAVQGSAAITVTEAAVMR